MNVRYLCLFGQELDSLMIETLLCLILLLECHLACQEILYKTKIRILLIYSSDFTPICNFPWFMNDSLVDLLLTEFRILLTDYDLS